MQSLSGGHLVGRQREARAIVVIQPRVPDHTIAVLGEVDLPHRGRRLGQGPIRLDESSLLEFRIVDLALTVIAIGAAIVAMVRCECRDCNG